MAGAGATDSPAVAVKRSHAPTLVFHGGRDSSAPEPQAAAFVDALRTHGIEAREQVFPTLGHDLRSAAMRPAQEFLLSQLHR